MSYRLDCRSGGVRLETVGPADFSQLRDATREMALAQHKPKLKSYSDLVENEAVKKLIHRGVPKDPLLLLARMIPDTSNQRLELVPGIEERTLRRLPDRVKALADTIQRVNESPWLANDGLRRLALATKPRNSLPEASRTKTAEELIFAGIPRALRSYATHLRAWINSDHPVGSYGKERIRMQTLLTLKLLNLVRDSTGRPHYSEVATLLEAAYSASGKPKTIPADDLGKLERNNPTLRLIARFLDVPKTLR